MNAAKNVAVIPVTRSRYAVRPQALNSNKRVAAYARVSTDKEEQHDSYEAQVDHYTRLILNNELWDFVKVYTDDGISATNTKRREGFNEMIADAMTGKIDTIITKSVSRFARNTVDSLVTVRKLKEKGVAVYFEKENIDTLDSKGELLITIMSSLAQEESRSISENVTWGKRKQLADGKVYMPYGQFLGYQKGEDGLPEIVEDEARVVRLIYKLFLEGKTVSWIARHLMAQGILSPGGKKTWRPHTVESILTNEKYCGDARLQKTFTMDFLTKKVKVNEGEVQQYYVTGSHPAIVSPEVYEIVQSEMTQRRASGRQSSSAHCFSGKIICGECGKPFGSKIWHSNDKYRRMVWQCNHKYKSEKKCSVPHLSEEQIKLAFVEAINRLITNKDAVLAAYKGIVKTLSDTSALEAELEQLQEEAAVCSQLMRKSVDENSRVALDQEEYQRRCGGYLERFEQTSARIVEVKNEIAGRTAKRKKIGAFLKLLQQQEGLVQEFDEELWYATVQSVTVYSKERVTFTFKSGEAIDGSM